MFQGLNSNIQVFNLMNFREELQEELMNLDVGKVLAPEKAKQIRKRRLHQWMERVFFARQSQFATFEQRILWIYHLVI